ncbi:MAG: cytochrome b/b6 domain-containing protein [Pseudomonadota bacterium]
MEPDQPAPTSAQTVYRHRLTTRLWHWINAITIFIMIGSGLMIFNAHPHLYWGEYGANYDHAWFHGSWIWGGNGRFPGWLTIPQSYNLALARRWHLIFALVLGFGLLAFMIASLINRHFQRDLRVRAKEIAPKHLIADAAAHARFEFHNPDDPAAYNTLQKLAYVAAIFILIPVMILTGLAMSPGMDAAWPWLTAMFGGRPSARSVHFIAASLLVGFIVVHLALVILAGPIEEVRSMITGWWKLPPIEPQRETEVPE